ncbi:MAG: enoyl-CoA hydratase/isomerase family protein, partial [Gammaproteobacteria bacterium]|nr:enoyl-CoA hydratase/isomerase family protein [Gammaproteobacteria bacterium]
MKDPDKKNRKFLAAVSLNEANSPVLLYEHAVNNGMVVVEARLHAEATLNSLSLEMIKILSGALSGWALRDEVVALLITSAGNRAFCAGGDIQALYYSMLNNHTSGEAVDEYPYQFFEHEYRLNYHLHTYPKPVVAI